MTSKKQIQAKNAELEKYVNDGRDQLYLANKWIDAMLELHQPQITSVIDVSLTESHEMCDKLLDRLGHELFCLECSKRWPCKEIDRLRTLRGIVDPLSNVSRTTSLEAIDQIERKTSAYPVIETSI